MVAILSRLGDDNTARIWEAESGEECLILARAYQRGYCQRPGARMAPISPLQAPISVSEFGIHKLDGNRTNFRVMRPVNSAIVES